MLREVRRIVRLGCCPQQLKSCLSFAQYASKSEFTLLELFETSNIAVHFVYYIRIALFMTFNVPCDMSFLGLDYLTWHVAPKGSYLRIDTGELVFCDQPLNLILRVESSVVVVDDLDVGSHFIAFNPSSLGTEI